MNKPNVLTLSRTVLSPVCSLILCAGMIAPAAAFAQQKQDQSGSRTIVADQTKNNPTDLQLARNIRRDLVKDKTLSANGRNVKVVVQDGRITIRGPVRNDDERKKVLEIAQKYSGGNHVVDQIILPAGGK